MPNILDHIEENFLSFSECPFNDVDSLILSQLSYIHFDVVFSRYLSGTQIEIRDLLRAEDMDAMLLNVREPEKNRKMLYALAASPRYRNMRLGNYKSLISNILEEQFAAVTFYTPDEQAYIVFRGTDSSLVGWKEDFNMAFKASVPAQFDALRYLEDIAEQFSGWIHLSGHSKGGNLAVYAAAYAEPEIQAQIQTIYAHDAPGFLPVHLETDGYRRIQHRIRKTIPQSSVIGLLLENQDTYTIIESRQLGIMQHDPFSWTVENGSLKTLDSLDSGAKYTNSTLSTWLAGMTMVERERLVDALYSVLSAGEITNIYDLSSTLQPSNLIAMHNAASELDPETRDFVFRLLRRLGTAAKENLPKFQIAPGFLNRTENDPPRTLERISETFSELLPKATELLSKPAELFSRATEELGLYRTENTQDPGSALPEESEPKS